MPVLNRKRSRASGRVSGRRRTAHEQEDHDMDQDQEEEENEEEEEEAEEVPARRGRDQRNRHSSAQQQPATSQRSRVQVQGRRRQTEPEEEEQEDVEMDDGNNDGNGLRARKRRRRRDDSDDDDDDEEEEEAEDAPGEKSRGGNDPVAKFVRFALACEYQKKPIRRPEITEKVLMPHHKNEFKTVFDETQKALRRTFGMELIELPANREKVSLKQQRRAAAQEAVPNAAKNKKKQNAKTDETATNNTASPTSTSNTAKAWILTSILPEIYKEPDIIAPYQNDELALHGFGMVIVTLVYLSNRALNDKVLDRYLKRLKSEETIAVEGTADTGKTDNILVSLVRNGYLVKVKDDTPPGQEESFTYKIGPRGKVEVGKEGVRNMVKMIYGEEVPDNFDRMIARSIGLDKEEIEAGAAAAAAEREEDEEGGGAPRRAAPANNDRRGANQGRGARAPAGRGGRRRREEEEEDEDEDEEEDADDDEEEEEEDEDGDDSE